MTDDEEGSEDMDAVPPQLNTDGIPVVRSAPQPFHKPTATPQLSENRFGLSPLFYPVLHCSGTVVSAAADDHDNSPTAIAPNELLGRTRMK